MQELFDLKRFIPKINVTLSALLCGSKDVQPKDLAEQDKD